MWSVAIFGRYVKIPQSSAILRVTRHPDDGWRKPNRLRNPTTPPPALFTEINYWYCNSLGAGRTHVGADAHWGAQGPQHLLVDVLRLLPGVSREGLVRFALYGMEAQFHVLKSEAQGATTARTTLNNKRCSDPPPQADWRSFLRATSSGVDCRGATRISSRGAVARYYGEGYAGTRSRGCQRQRRTHSAHSSLSGSLPGLRCSHKSESPRTPFRGVKLAANKSARMFRRSDCYARRC